MKSFLWFCNPHSYSLTAPALRVARCKKKLIMKWLISKIGSLFTLIGIPCMFMLSHLDSDKWLLNGSLIVGLIAGIYGYRFGCKMWDEGNPFTFLFNPNWAQHRMSCAISWAFRFFFMPFILAVIFRLFVH